MNNALATVIDKGDRLYEGLNLDLLIDSKHWIPFIDVLFIFKLSYSIIILNLISCFFFLKCIKYAIATGKSTTKTTFSSFTSKTFVSSIEIVSISSKDYFGKAYLSHLLINFHDCRSVVERELTLVDGDTIIFRFIS